MSIFTSHPPKINKKKLIKWLIDNYNFTYKKKISLKELNSERDKSFLLSINNISKFVIKISNKFESKKFLELQDYVIKSLNKKSSIKKIIPKVIHRKIKTFIDEINSPCFVRILSYIEGKMYADSKNTIDLECSLGSYAGILSKELQNLGHEAAFRRFEWDPSSLDWIKNYINLFKSNRKKIIQNNLNEYICFVKKNKSNLRYSLTHGDVNNYNLVVSNNKIIGLLDYGDMIFAPTINDLAICLAYALMNKKNLYDSLKTIILNYHNQFPLTFNEIFSLMTIVKCRLTITVIMAEKQIKKFPKNKYLVISQKDAWSLLYKLDKINPYIFVYLIRDFCNYPITKNYRKLISYLRTNKFSKIFDKEINEFNKSIINLEAKSPFNSISINNPKKLTKKIKNYLFKNNAEIGLGLYGEKRNVYKGNNFISFFNSNERRNIHLGIDFFIKEGTTIKSPIDGKIVILHNNEERFDYGPTVVLEHKVNSEIKFYTLYGHLSEKCLKKLSIGKKIKEGDKFAEIGNFPINGNWSPHLHFQIIIDLMNEKKNFPGVSEKNLWSMWSKISPNPNLIFKIPETFFNKNKNIDNLISKRKSLVSHNLSISYKKPIQFLEGKYQYLYDDKGRQYLDCVNNISHVGHCHPRIHKALTSQNLKLNTNSRYIYKIMNDYSQNLLSKFPKKLDTIFFVCTGSEANDLAYRIAQVYTKAKDVLVMDNAYHGHTNSLIDLSPYKFKNKGGSGQKEYVHIAEMPDGIRGKWTYSDSKFTEKYINQVKLLIDNIKIKKNKNLSCFFVESILGCGGQIILPKNYLKEIFKLVRKNKALCIVDEVQTGFGRVGNHFWAFEEHKVVPDIVTLGKPMGNGHPIGAVITTKEIANAFNNGMEYFNSFGGNPVSCAVGNTVLEVINEEKLQSHANQVGKYFLYKLQKIKKEFPQYISEVRGRGLFIGIDLIKNGNNLLPNKYLALNLVNNLRNKGILLSIDGPHHNVIKIKPPLPFDKSDVDFVCYEINDYLLHK